MRRLEDVGRRMKVPAFGLDQEQAEGKLRQMYHRCSILECRVVDDVARGDGTDLEGAISLMEGASP